MDIFDLLNDYTNEYDGPKGTTLRQSRQTFVKKAVAAPPSPAQSIAAELRQMQYDLERAIRESD